MISSPGYDLNGRVAVVTGAGSGIGRALAVALAGHGVHVLLVGRNTAKLDAARSEAIASGGQASVCPCDLGSDSDIDALAAAVTAEHGQVDILAHSAGAIALGAVEATSVEDFDLQYRVNVRAPFLLTQRLLPMLRQAHGQVVFVNSSVGVRTKENVGAYAASKHALKALADTLRMEVNASGVRVLSVFPGNTATDMQRAIQAQAGRAFDPALMLQPADVASAVIGALRMPASAEITDIHVRPMRKA